MYDERRIKLWESFIKEYNERYDKDELFHYIIKTTVKFLKGETADPKNLVRRIKSSVKYHYIAMYNIIDKVRIMWSIDREYSIPSNLTEFELDILRRLNKRMYYKAIYDEDGANDFMNILKNDGIDFLLFTIVLELISERNPYDIITSSNDNVYILRMEKDEKKRLFENFFTYHADIFLQHTCHPYITLMFLLSDNGLTYETIKNIYREGVTFLGDEYYDRIFLRENKDYKNKPWLFGLDKPNLIGEPLKYSTIMYYLLEKRDSLENEIKQHVEVMLCSTKSLR